MSIKVRAVDDLGNLQNVLTAATVRVSPNCPCSVFSPTDLPANASYSASQPVELGV